MREAAGALTGFDRMYSPPSDWNRTTIESLADVIGGGTPSRDEASYWRGGTIPWVTPTDVTACKGKYLGEVAEQITRLGLANSAARLLPPGATLFTSRATIGARVLSNRAVVTNQGFASLVPKAGCDAEYLYYLSELLTPLIIRLGSGTTFLEVSKRDMKRLACAVPPRGEQEAIARILDAVDTAIAKQEAAVERAEGVTTALTQELLIKGTRGTKQRKTRIGWLPESWDVSSVAQVTTSLEYGLSLSMHSQGEIPILRMGNLQAGRVLLNDLKYVTLSPTVRERYLVRPGDVLFNRVNSQELVGKVAIYRETSPCVFASYLVRVHANPDLIDNWFLGHVLNSYPTQCRIKRYATPGVQQVNINASNLGRVLIPVPRGPEGLQEQREIAKALEQSLSAIDQKRQISMQLADLKRSLSHDLLTGRVRVPMEVAA